MKRSASFYIGLFLIGTLPLVALNCPTNLEQAAQILTEGAYTVDDATGLPSFTFSGTTTITFNGGDPITEGTFSVSGAANLPRIVVNDEQVSFPASGTYIASGPEDGSVTSIELTDGDGNSLTLAVTTLSEGGDFTFTYPGAEPKVADENTVTVTCSR